ncbi:hypothetical protein HYPP_04385 [Hyphomicrobium sp. ghe19]|nr:hypothetical protein HYPP_04385 [Hyphomicrobium sp. ghe19]
MASGLSPEHVRTKLRLMNTWIKLAGPDWTQTQLEKHEGFFTTCAVQGLEPNWDRLIPGGKHAQEGPLEAPTAVKLSSEGNDPIPLVLRKSCKACGECKPLTDFYNRPDSKDRRHSSCKACMTAKAIQAKAA